MKKFFGFLLLIIFVSNVIAAGYFLSIASKPEEHLGDPFAYYADDFSSTYTEFQLDPGHDYHCQINANIIRSSYDFNIRIELDNEHLLLVNVHERDSTILLDDKILNYNFNFQIGADQAGLISFNNTYDRNIRNYQYSIYQDPPAYFKNSSNYLLINFGCIFATIVIAFLWIFISKKQD